MRSVKAPLAAPPGCALAWAAGVVVAVAACSGASFTGVSGPGDDGGGSEGGNGNPEGGSGDGNASNDGSKGNGDGSQSNDGSGGKDAQGTDSGGGGGTYCGPNLQCTGKNGQQGTICCYDNGQYACAAANCGCATQLDCASDLDCGGATPFCCIDQRNDANCPAGHFVARCETACINGAKELCDPNSQQQQCVNGSCQSDASCVGLPQQQGFGVCGGC